MKTRQVFLGSLLLMLAPPLLLAGCGGKEERKIAHLQKGKAYYEQAEYDKAGVEIKNVLQIDPKNPDAYYLAGLIEEKRQDWSRAFGDYFRASELSPNNMEAKAKLGRFYLAAGETAKAEQIVKDILAANPADPQGLTLKAAFIAQQGDVTKAIELAQQVLAANPSQSDAAPLLAGLYSRQNDDKRAEAVVAQAINADPKNIPLRLVHSTILVKLKDTAGAEREFKDIIAIEPNDLGHRAALASFYSRNGQLDKAEAALRDAIQAGADDEQRYLLLADFLAATRGAEPAERELEQNLNAKPRAFSLGFGLADLYQRTGNLDKAGQAYQRIIDLDGLGPNGLKARPLLASVDLSVGRAKEAEDLIAQVLKQNPHDNQALLLRAQMAINKNDWPNAIADLRAVLRDQPDSVTLAAMLAKAHLQNGEPQLAKETLSNAVSLYPKTPGFRLAFIDYLTSAKDYAGALKEAEELIKIDRTNVRAYAIKTDIQAAQGDLAGAEATLRNLTEAAPDQPRGHLLLGRFYLTQKKYDKAAGEFEAAAKFSPKPSEAAAVSALAATFLLAGKPDKAITRLRQEIGRDPENAALQIVLGDIYLKQNKWGDAEQCFHNAVTLNPKSPDGYLALSRYSAARGNLAAAATPLQEGLAAMPGQANLLAALAEISQRQGNYTQAIAEYETLVKENPGDESAANNLAALLTDFKGDKASLEQALALTRRFEYSTNPYFIDSLGWVQFKLGQYDEAATLLSKAVDNAPEIAVMHYHLGMALLRKGDVASAKAQLKTALASDKHFPGWEEAKQILTGS